MEIKEKTLDDLMHRVFEELKDKPFDIETSRGITAEVLGVLLILENPLARLSLTETKGKAFSALGELFWYLTKSNDLNFIEFYIPEYSKESETDENGIQIVHGGYGPRLFNKEGINQIDNVIQQLKVKPTTRRAVIQLFDASDINAYHKDVPCTCTLQFLIRDNKLTLYTTMRSNDAYLGLPHDIFAFTMLQEIMAKTLRLELGYYYHSVGSLHIYQDKLEAVKLYLEEGWQSTKKAMPSMPDEDPWKQIEKLLSVEPRIRKGENIDFDSLGLPPYWTDLARLLQVQAFSTKGQLNPDGINEVRKYMVSDVYDIYIEKKLQVTKNRRKREMKDE